jgi:hypothetical protein
MPFDLPSVSDIIGLPGARMAALNQATQQASQEQSRKTAAYNALRNIYGDIAGDPAAAAKLQAMKQEAEMFPLLMQQRELGNQQTAQNISQSEQAFPYKLAGEQTKIEHTQAATTATRAAAQKADLGNQQTEQALTARQALFGLQQMRQAITNGADPEAAFTAVAPAIAKSLGRPVEDIIRMGQAFKANPQALTLFEQQLQQIAQPLNGVVLTPEGVSLAAEQYSRTGQMPALGMGKSATAARSAIINTAAQGGATAQGMIESKNDIKAQQTYAADLAKSGPGTAGGLVRSAGAVLAHIDLLDQYITALGNGDVKAANSISQSFKEQTGKAAPTQFDAQKTIVTDELTRYLIARGGGVHDRQQMQEQVSRANSPGQLRAVIQTWKSDMVGQLEAQAAQADGLGMRKQFDAVMTPHARDLLRSHGAPAAAPASTGKHFRYNPATGRLE